MSPQILYIELMRLTALYAVACSDKLSCPRNRSILKTRICDLEEMVESIKTERPADTREMEQYIQWESQLGDGWVV